MHRSVTILTLLVIMTFRLTAIVNNPDISLDSCILIKGKSFQGTLFQENYEFDLSPDKSKKLIVKPLWYLTHLAEGPIKPWTPRIEKIKEIELKIPELLRRYTTKDDYESENLPEIIATIDKYKRQYIGFKDFKDSEYLWIQFIYSESKMAQPDKSIIRILGGGSSVFILTLDLRKWEIKELIINGPI
ncbi:hypothetical protein DMA11_22920 [Marinilabiliaceae bacterium JC017]|nr:hypothetical protein DMA11_22920 [Marinilabiliaceae bacterium JC017]